MAQDARARTNVQGDRSPANNNVVYTAVTPNRLNMLDRVARFALAVIHSSNPLIPAREQHFIGQRTLAAALSGGTLYLAANNVFTESYSYTRGYGHHAKRMHGFRTMSGQVALAMWNNLGSELQSSIASDMSALELATSPLRFNEMIFVQNPFGDDDTKYHAEMQLVRYFYDRGLRLDNDRMGVSKPCCRGCSTRLDLIGIDHTFYHNEFAYPWQDPEVMAHWW